MHLVNFNESFKGAGVLCVCAYPAVPKKGSKKSVD